MQETCTLCPRGCGVDRREVRGFCGESDVVRIGRVALHPWEEPPISGTRGSGTIFFSGCTLRCAFCQNRAISRDGVGGEITTRRLADLMLELQERGAHNLNLVTGTQFLPQILAALKMIEGERRIPVVWNTGGYETEETIDALSEYVSVWLPDFKYADPTLARRLSFASDYPEVAARAIARMYRHAGAFRTDDDGIATSGVIVRHLVLPGCRKDSIAVLLQLAALVPVEDIRLSLMWQYTPDFLPDGEEWKPFRRRVTSFEYESVEKCAEELGFVGFLQDRSAATAAYTPKFSGDAAKNGVDLL